MNDLTMYILRFTKHFRQRYAKLTKRDRELEMRIRKALDLLTKNPKHPSLRTHKVDSKKFKRALSSWVIGDLRIEWRYAKGEKPTILLLGIGGHSGKHKIYK